jgi:hypothetical protein
MAETNISANKTTGQVIEADHVNELKSALVTTLSGRNSTGTLAPNQNLGSATYPWGIGYINSIISNGSLVDFSALTSESNSIKSGQTRSTSDLSDFIRASGSGASATIQAATTNLVCTINAAAVTATADIALSSLTTASAGATEVCNINDVSLADQVSTKYLGGESNIINIDAVGASITSKVGKVICLRAPGGELMLAYVKSNTELSNIKRGYFLNSSGLPIVRETLANNDTLTLMSLGYVFLENDGATVEVSYLNPVYSFETPNSPATGQYWFDLQVKSWKRYNGSDFVVINRILIGIVIIDTTDCIGSRSLDFDLGYSELNSISFNEFTNTSITSSHLDNSTSINSNNFTIKNKIIFNITTDLAVGLSESPDTNYYLYLTEDGERVMDVERPYDFNPFLKGFYHPYNTWRCIAVSLNDSSSNLSYPISVEFLFKYKTTLSPTIQKFTSGSGTYTTPAGVRFINVQMVGAGAGGSGSGASATASVNGSNGGNTTFGTSLLTTNGGLAGSMPGAGGAGGVASLGTGSIGTLFSGGQGEGYTDVSNTTTFMRGGAGGSSYFGYHPGGTSNANATNADANTGEGGGGAGGGTAIGMRSGIGGGGGGFIDAIINSPSATYSYAVGAAGAGGTAGTSGFAGGAGGSGYIEVREYY